MSGLITTACAPILKKLMGYRDIAILEAGVPRHHKRRPRCWVSSRFLVQVNDLIDAAMIRSFGQAPEDAWDLEKTRAA